MRKDCSETDSLLQTHKVLRCQESLSPLSSKSSTPLPRSSLGCRSPRPSGTVVVDQLAQVPEACLREWVRCCPLLGAGVCVGVYAGG